MAFSDIVIKEAWERASGQCECQHRNHSHFYVPCGKPLVMENRGKMSWGGWELKQLDPNKGETLSNCELVCMTCYGMKY
jgi:hypothetical protein